MTECQLVSSSSFYAVEAVIQGVTITGGGIHNRENLTLDGVVITESGRGVRSMDEGSKLTISNSTIYNNTGSTPVHIDGGDASIFNSTISGNTTTARTSIEGNGRWPPCGKWRVCPSDKCDDG